MGHTFVKRHPNDTQFVGICPYHHDCLARLVAEPTFEVCLGISSTQVSLENHVWDIMAYYVAQAAIQQTMILRPANIVFGGGVMNENFLIKIR